MTNTNTPFGLALSRSQDAYYSGVVTQCYVPATNSDKLYVGDAVVKSTGSNAAEIMGNKAGSLPTIAKASTSGALDGVIVGFLPDGDNYKAGVLAASTAGVALVIDNPMAKFNIQANGEATAAMVGKYANLTLSTSGNDYSGISGMALDISSVDTDASKQLKIVGVADYVTNELGNYSVLEVVLNKPCNADLSGYLTKTAADEAYQAKLTAGDFVAIDADTNTITTTYSAGTGIAISDEGEISASGGQ